MPALTTEKIDQVVALLEEMEIDAWLTFVRETGTAGDPVLPLVFNASLTWPSALFVTRTGETIAIVGKFDADATAADPGWKRVVPYVHGIGEPLLAELERIDPGRIAINYSPDDVQADGLSHGMYLLLARYLEGTRYADRLISAAGLIGALRGRKTAGEVARIRRAISHTEELFDLAGEWAAVGRTEAEVARFMKRAAAERQLGLAWEAAQCPIVNSGPDSMFGHGVPSDIAIRPGHLFHIDFGVTYRDYCSDLQRMWYVLEPGEDRPPEPVLHAFESVVRSIRQAAQAIRPGLPGWQVDAAARSSLVDSGYPEYAHATGHGVGRSAHDGGAGLMPRWEQYGDAPNLTLDVGNVLTIEPSILDVAGRGALGLEEMVIVTPQGCEFMSNPQTKIRLLRA